MTPNVMGRRALFDGVASAASAAAFAALAIAALSAALVVERSIAGSASPSSLASAPTRC